MESRCHRETFSTTIRSVTYIGEGIIVESDKHIEASRNQYRQGVTNTFGPKSISEDKDKYWGQDLEAIGWQLNTRYDRKESIKYMLPYSFVYPWIFATKTNLYLSCEKFYTKMHHY